jgi:single-strand DNA-binding protein
MIDINHVVLIGRLTRDAELKYTSGGTAVCKFSIAVNRRKKNGDEWVDEVSYFDISLWGRQGETLNQYLLKGKQVGVGGELRQERWEDRDSGKPHSRIEIIAGNIQLLGGGNNNGGNGGDSGTRGGGSGKGNAGSYQGEGKTRENDDGFTDDIPY